MSNLDLLKYQFENTFKLSLKAKSYIENLVLAGEINIFFKMPEGYSGNDVGLALVEEREIYIMPTDNSDIFEIRLIHELTHIAINDKGYPNLSCDEDDMLAQAFANLLHHFIIYDKIKKFGFSMEQDNMLVMENIEQRLAGFKELCEQGSNDAVAYIIITIINDLIRLGDDKKIKYIEIVKQYIPRCLDKANEILNKIKLSNISDGISIECYKNWKVIIERELDIETFHFLPGLLNTK